MEKKIKVENCLINSDIYLNCESMGSITYILPKRLEGKKDLPYILLTEEEVIHIKTRSTMFERGFIRVIDDVSLPDSVKDLTGKEVVTVNDIDEILSLTLAKFKKKLLEIDRIDFLNELMSQANKRDNIATSFIKAIEDRIDGCQTKIIIEEPKEVKE